MNILIVDDEIDTLDEIDFYVKKYKQFDCSVVCTNALEALDEAEKTCFDSALIDIEMPVMNGLELAERLLKLFPSMRVAFITAYNHYATEAFDVNAIDYILKPVREERLFKALDRLVNKKKQASEKENKPELYIQTFGKFVVKIGEDIVKWKRQKASELLAYLLENRERPVHKEKLCDLLWPDLEPKKALVNLQTTIYSIRKTLGEYDNREISIKYAGNNYTLHIKKVCIDMIEFENTLEKALDLKDITFLKSALRIYNGDYLDEEGWIWAESRKELLRKKYTAALKNLKRAYKT